MTTWASFLLYLFVSCAAPSYGFLSLRYQSTNKMQLTLSYDRRVSVHSDSMRYTIYTLSMGFFDGLWTRLSPRRKVDSTDILYMFSEGRVGCNRRFFDPPAPLIYPKTPEILGEILKTDSLSSHQAQSRSHGFSSNQSPWTADDHHFNSSEPSRFFDDHNGMTLSSPAIVIETDELLVKVDKDKEQEKRAWIEMILDPNRYQRVRSSTKSSTQASSSWISSSRSSSIEVEDKLLIDSRYSPTNRKTDFLRTTSELDTFAATSPYLRNREAINMMLQRRSSDLKEDNFVSTQKCRVSTSLPTSFSLSNLNSESDADLQKTRSVIKQFYSSKKNDIDIDREDKDDVQSFAQRRVEVQSPGFMISQNIDSNKYRVKESASTPPKTIRMKLPIPDDENEGDGIDAQENPNLSLRDAVQKLSNKVNAESQVDRSKKWGIDMSKFT